MDKSSRQIAENNLLSMYQLAVDVDNDITRKLQDLLNIYNDQEGELDHALMRESVIQILCLGNVMVRICRNKLVPSLISELRNIISSSDADPYRIQMNLYESDVFPFSCLHILLLICSCSESSIGYPLSR